MMPAETPTLSLDPSLAALLGRLRQRIRAYVWIEGAALTLVVLGVAFWLSLAFDWSVEPPRAVRAVVLILTAAASVWVIYRFILRRAFARLSDQNLALLLERRFPVFGDSLVTAVELSGDRPGGADALFHPEMIRHTRQAALAHAGGVQLLRVFRWQRLAVRIVLALLLALSLVGFALASREAFAVWRQRAFLQSDAPWPRRTSLEVEGFKHAVKVAKGSDLEIRVRAGGEVPESVEIRYATEDGARVRENMTREGVVAATSPDGQVFTYTMKAIASPITFDVLGGDNRLRNLKIDVVDSPLLSQVTLHCEFPAYLHRDPRDLPVTGLMQLPTGTDVTVTATSNKDLAEVPIHRLVGDKVESLGSARFPAGGDQRTFSFALGKLAEYQTLQFTLLDADGIRSREPVRVALSALPDDPPRVAVRLRSIGTSITPQARLPIEGEISDDYGIAAAWFEYTVSQPAPKQRAAGVEATSEQPARQEFRAKLTGAESEKFDRRRDEAFDVQDLQLKVGQRLTLQVKVADTYDLTKQPNVGAGEQYQLDIVRTDQLLSVLQARELALRRQFETMIQDATDTRDLLASLRVTGSSATPKKKPAPKSATALTAGGTEPEDAATRSPADRAAEPGDRPTVAEVNTPQKRLLIWHRVMQNSERSAHETLALAGSFEEILDELSNNRMDTPEVTSHLRDQIALPLRQISEQSFSELETRLHKLEKALTAGSETDAATGDAVHQADAVIVEMQQVLSQMLELESFNEAVEKLRALIDTQIRLNEDTLRHQKEDARRRLGD